MTNLVVTMHEQQNTTVLSEDFCIKCFNGFSSIATNNYRQPLTSRRKSQAYSVILIKLSYEKNQFHIALI